MWLIMQWDLLSNERFVRELAYVINGENPENRVSVMQVNVSFVDQISSF